MGKDNKYYDLVVSLVKQHRKFPGYEVILDEIVDDVIAHSEVVINSISNENVIKSYLEKVISTSIITVPKRMDFHKGLSHKTITNNTITEQTVEDEHKPQFAEPKKSNNELVDRMINSIEVEDVHSVIESDESSFESENSDLNDIANDALEEVSYEAFDESDSSLLFESVSDNNVKVDDSKSENEENLASIMSDDKEESIVEQVNTFDEGTVEEELSSLDEDPDFDVNNEYEVIEQEDIEQTDSENNDSQSIEDFEEVYAESVLENNELDVQSVENLIELQSDENIDDNETAESSIDIQEAPLSLVEDETDNIEQGIILDLPQSEYDNIEKLDLIDNETELADDNGSVLEVLSDDNEENDSLIENDSYDIKGDLQEESDSDGAFAAFDSELQEDNFIENNSDDIGQDFFKSNEFEDSLSVDAAEGYELTEDTNELLVEDSFADSEEFEKADDSVNKFNPTNYAVFKFSPEEQSSNLNSEDVVKSLSDFDRKNPDLKISEVYDLKYKQHKTISSIAEELGLTKTYLAEILNEMAELL